MHRLRPATPVVRPRNLRLAGVTAALLAVGLFAGACGGGNSGGSNDGEQAQTATGETGAGNQHDATGNGSEQQGATGGDGEEGEQGVAQAPVPSEPATINWWHNGSGEPLYSFWETVAREFETAHPNVRVNVHAYQNEELRNTVLPDAFAGGNPPDLFQSWGGGELVRWVNEGKVRDLSETNAATIERLGSVVEPWQVAGHTYGLPYRFGPSGFWYNKDVFARAGIDPATFEAPDTLDELFALWDQLKAAGETPVALGGESGWPAAHWYYWAAVRACTPQALQLATTDHDFSDPCWLTAGQYLRDIAGKSPFNSAWRTTPAQGDATSSSGMVAMGTAAMELTGDWAPTVMADIAARETGTVVTELPTNLGWFPFPEIPGAAGDPSSILGGGDGFSISADAPEATNALLDYILSPDVQERFAALGYLATSPGADDAVAYQPLQSALADLRSADHVQLWFDVALGTDFHDLNGTIIDFLAEPNASPQVIVDQLKAIAGQS